jgi:hypothetical protein
MSQVKFNHRFIIANLLVLALGTLFAKVAYAQRPIFLLDNQCINTGSGNWGRNARDVSVGREIYTSLMTMSSWGPNDSAAMTCKIQASSSATLRLGFGMRDNDIGSSPSIVDVYVNGNHKGKQTVYPGKVSSLLVDISNGNSLAVETTCSRASNCQTVYFFKAELTGLKNTASPGER